MNKPSLNKPIFLLASERSGSNLLRAMMGSHSNIVAPTSPHLLQSFGPRLPAYSGDKKGSVNIELLAKHLQIHMSKQIGAWQYNFDASKIVDELKISNIVCLLDYVYSKELGAQGGQRAFFKENGTYDYVHRLMSRYPDIKFVYLVRDGRDVVLSMKKSPVHIGNLTEFAKLWAKEQRKILELLFEIDDEDRILVVHYEDLVGDSTSALKRVCRFIDEPFEPAMTEFHSNKKNISAAGDMSAWRNLSKPILGNNVSKYRDQFSKSDLRAVEAAAFRELIRCGYQVGDRQSIVERRSNASFKYYVGRALSMIFNMLRGDRLSMAEIRARKDKVEAIRVIEEEIDNQLTPLTMLES